VVYVAYFLIMVVGPGGSSDGSNKKRLRFFGLQPRLDMSRGRGVVALFPDVSRCCPIPAFAMATMIQFLIFPLRHGLEHHRRLRGQVDLGKAQYVGIGAYTTAVMLIRWDVPFWVSMPIGMCLPWGGRLLSVIPCSAEGPLLRHRHHRHLAGAEGSSSRSGISWGGPRPGNFAHRITPGFPAICIFKEDIYYYYVILVFFLVGLLFINWFRKSRLGFQLRAIKDNEDVARSLGINVHWAKIKTYAIATAYVSMVGSFHACYINIEPEDTMSLDISILIALMAMLGGAGSLWGPIIGAGILIPLKSYLKEWLGGQAGLAGMDLILYAVIIMVIGQVSRGACGASWNGYARRKRS
jgi:branched-chain amino acid transport system permease protein